MSDQDHSRVLSFYAALRNEADAERAARLARWTPEPIEVVTARIKALIDAYLEH